MALPPASKESGAAQAERHRRVISYGDLEIVLFILTFPFTEYERVMFRDLRDVDGRDAGVKFRVHRIDEAVGDKGVGRVRGVDTVKSEEAPEEAAIEVVAVHPVAIGRDLLDQGVNIHQG